ncbi:hypothetical protein [Rugamonas rubra]|jgi:hypothetical protein|uniref:Uncharacterized protein n=1 Tax=Rugamonas rubra TaxID=758825 RepID=A0A1I4M501_9BURK|nr:hypothetical protein [Rugamonas rubra]SFL98274.1 hypothetical protein SAMN02982985_02246 [Rugamonas rubra]
MINANNSRPGGAQSQGAGAPHPGADNPLGQAAQQGAADAMAFQLWVSQQATSLAKLKVFHSMAKQVNDQQ